MTSEFDSRRYQIFWEVVSLERGPLSLVSTTGELLGRKSSGSGLEIRKYGLGIRCADQATRSIRESWHYLWKQAAVICRNPSAGASVAETWFYKMFPQNWRPYFTLSFEIPPTWRTRCPYVYPPGTGWPSCTPGHWVPFPSPLTTRRATAEIF
jgi:hypothetical protein